MGWLSDRDIKHRYKMPDGSIRHLVLSASAEASPAHTFGDFITGVYSGFEPDVVEQVTVIEYEQNGRKAVKVRNKDGSTRYVSKSKLNYLKTGRIENQYTKEYQDHLIKTKQTELLRSGVGKGKGKARKANEAMMKNLPDGEYVSDGTNVMPAPAGMGDETK